MGRRVETRLNSKEDAPLRGAEVPLYHRVWVVFGPTRYGSGHLLWDVPLELTPGAQTLTLNERNAMPME